MGYLQTIGIGLVLFLSSIITSTLGGFHFALNSPINSAAQPSLATTSNQVTTTLASPPPENNKVPVGIYSKDTSHVYNSGGGIIPGADPATFTLCDPDPSHDDCAKDASHVYLDDVVLQNADPASFVELNFNYGKDKNYVFFLKSGDEGPLPHIIAGADPQSFVAVGGGYGKDTNNVYWFGVSISPPVDPQTFSLINGNNSYYLKDAQHVYLLDNYKVTDIVGADPETFTLLSNANEYTYAKDMSHVYYGAKLIPNADVLTFQVISGNGYDAEDKLHKYLQGEAVN